MENFCKYFIYRNNKIVVIYLKGREELELRKNVIFRII